MKESIRKINKRVFGFSKKHKYLVISICICLLIMGISRLISYAFFTANDSRTLISGKIGDVTNPDLDIKLLIENRDSNGDGDGTYTTSYIIPTDNYTYNASISGCDNGTLIYNSDDNSFSVPASGKVKCNIYYDADAINYGNDLGLILMKEKKSPSCKGNCGYEEVTDLSVTGLINSGYMYNSDLSNCTGTSTISFDYSTNEIDTFYAGKDTCTAYFKVSDAPIIRNVTLEASTTTSLTLQFNMVEAAPAATNYYYSFDDTNYTEASGNMFSISGLTVATIYPIYFKVKSADNKYSNVVLFSFDTDYIYTGTFNYSIDGVQTYTAGANGYYQLQVWGAQGGSYSADSAYYGGLGGYATGTVYLPIGTPIFIYIGGAGTYYETSTYTSQGGGGFNGGGGAGYKGGGGGGATDIRIGQDSLYARVIVAGGGGGSYYYSSTYFAKGGAGGGATGADGNYYSSTYSTWVGGGGTQIAGGTAGVGSSTNYYGKVGTFGNGGSTGYKYNTTLYYSAGGGGGGWYGGGGAGNYSSFSRTRASGGGGGSGWIYTADSFSTWQTGNSGDADNWLLNSSYYLVNASFGNATREGNGYAIITYLGRDI